MSNVIDLTRQYANLQPGDPAPWFKQRAFSNPSYSFDSVAGRYIVLCFFGSAGSPLGRKALEGIAAHRDLFDDTRICCFGVTVDQADESEGRIRDQVPGVRFFLDFDGSVSRLYGALPKETAAGQVQIRPIWMVVDPSLRIMKVVPFAPAGAEQGELFAYLRALPPPELHAGIEIPAPILILPNVFEPEFCRQLIEQYELNGGEESGFMREVNGKTVGMHDPNHKRRKDFIISDPELIRQTQARILRRVAPEIRKVHFFNVTRMERYIVSCYAAEDGGHFAPHRDNTTRGTAHRRFAVSINLNGDFDGGEVWFPEYGPRRYKAPPGGAVIFSCPLLHAVSRVTAGRRYAFLPFLYDEEAAKLREENSKFLAGGEGRYKT